MNHQDEFEYNEHFNIEAEKAVLGAILGENSLIKETFLQPEFFYEHHQFGRHAKLFKTFKALDAKGSAIDMITISDILKNRAEKFGELGGPSYMAELPSGEISVKRFQDHVEIVLHHYKKREMIKLGAMMASGEMEDAEAEKRLQDIQSLGLVKKKRSKADVIGDIFNRVATNDGVIRGAKWGLRDLDAITNGLQRSSFVVVGARPSMGKSALGVNVTVKAAESKENPDGAVVAFFAAEQPEEQLMTRALCNVGRVDSSKLRMGYKAMDKVDWEKLSNAAGLIGDMDFEIFDQPGMDMNYIRRESRQMRKANPDADLIIQIDYLQMIKGNPVHRGNRTAEVGEIAQDCKIMARELDATVIGFAQLSRGVEQRQDKRPQMSDLRDSGEIEQAADVIALLYRPEYYDKETEDRNMLEIIIAKQREGPLGNAKVAFIKEYGLLLNIDWSNAYSHARTTVTKGGHVDDEPVTD